MLALSQIEHESDALVRRFFEARGADQYRHAATIFAQILVLVWLRDARRFHLFYHLCVAVAPLRRGQVRPAYAPQCEILPVVSHHPEECVVGFDDFTLSI